MTRSFSQANLLLLIGAGATSAGVALSGFVFAGLVYFSQEVEYKRFSEPGGRFEAVVMVQRGALLLPMMPGSGGDTSGTVKFFDADGNCHGSQDVERVGDVFVDWDEAGRAYFGVSGNLEELDFGAGEVALA